MNEKTKSIAGEFSEVLGPNSALCGEYIAAPLLLQVENDLKIPIRVVLKFVTIEDATTLFVEVAECP